MKTNTCLLLLLISITPALLFAQQSHLSKDHVSKEFSDPNFKLVVMQSLIEKERLDLGDAETLAEKVLKRDVNYELEGYELIPDVYDYLISFPISKPDLASIKEVTLDGGHDIYFYPMFFWSGESDVFDVQNLQDIALVPNLESLSISSMLEDGDLRYLASLKNLKVIELSSTVDFYNLEALLMLPKLKELHYFDSTIDPKYQNVINQLRDSGVKLKAY